MTRHKHDIANNIHSNALAKHNEEEHELQSTFHIIPIEKVPHQGSRELDRKIRLERILPPWVKPRFHKI